MKKFTLILFALCAIVCLFVSCENAVEEKVADSSSSSPKGNPPIGKWVSNTTISTLSENVYVFIEFRTDKVGIGINPAQNPTKWTSRFRVGDFSESDYATYTYTNKTITVNMNQFSQDDHVFDYTVNGDSMTLTKGMFGSTRLIFTKQPED